MVTQLQQSEIMMEKHVRNVALKCYLFGKLIWKVCQMFAYYF